jgi:hypothetical protein
VTISFRDLFVGSDRSHGEWHPDRGERGESITQRTAATDADYQNHLDGKLGLGLVPVRPDGTCRFATIDIDVDTIDHAKLYKKIAERKLPLTTFRSKSGGAHCSIFFQEPGRKAGEAITKLRKWAGLLGYPKAEIFPKQLKITSKDLGNWINLPYFGGDATTRYAVGPNGAIALDEFLSTVKFYTGQEDVDETISSELVVLQQLPPCLGKLAAEGIPEGSRNQALFNLGVYARKAFPNGWEDMVIKYNHDHFKPPLTNREVQSVIKSLSRTKYQYTCDVEPLVSRCDRGTCLTLPHGVGHMPWKEAGNHDEFLASNLRKITTDPPKYILEVCGVDIVLNVEQLHSHAKLKMRVLECTNKLIAPMKQEKWEQQLKDLLSGLVEIEAPKDASQIGLIEERVCDFLNLFDRSRGRDDILRGLPIEENEFIYFKVSDCLQYLKNKRLDKVDPTDLYRLLKSMGADHHTLKIKGKATGVWRLAVHKLNRQTEEFDQPKLEKIGEDL